MNELILGGAGSAMMSSKEIAEITGKEHKHVCRDIRNLVEALTGGPDLDHPGIVAVIDSRGYVDHFTLDFKATMTLITGYDAKRREMVVDRWLALETGAAKPACAQLPDFTNPADAARAWAEQFDAKQKALAEGAAARRQIEQDRPKVALADAISECEKAIRLEQFTKAVFERFKIGRNRLYKILRESKVLMFNNEPYQQYMERGWFKQVEKTYLNSKTEQIVPYFLVLITGKGQIGIFKLLEKHEAISKAVANA